MAVGAGCSSAWNQEPRNLQSRAVGSRAGARAGAGVGAGAVSCPIARASARQGLPLRLQLQLQLQSQVADRSRGAPWDVIEGKQTAAVSRSGGQSSHTVTVCARLASKQNGQRDEKHGSHAATDRDFAVQRGGIK